MTKEAAERASGISVRLRERGAWLITSASVCRRWSLDLDGMRYRIEAHASAFLEPPQHPGFVFSVTIRSARSGRPVPEDLLQTPWFRGLHARLGRHYVLDEIRGGRVRLARALRDTTEPSRVLHELHHVSAAIERMTISRRGARAQKRNVKPAEEQREDLWTILDALRVSGWRVSSLGQCLQRKVQHDGCRWHVSATFKALVDSSEGRPGFTGMVDSWSNRGERMKRSNPITKAIGLLRSAGYRRVADTHYNRWHRGLGRRAAEEELHRLEQAMRLMVE